MATCDVQTLMTDAKCFLPYAQGAQGGALTLQLLCELLTAINAGAFGGTTNMALGGAEPPSDGSVPTFRVFDTDTGFSWYNSGTIPAPVWNSV